MGLQRCASVYIISGFVNYRNIGLLLFFFGAGCYLLDYWLGHPFHLNQATSAIHQVLLSLTCLCIG